MPRADKQTMVDKDGAFFIYFQAVLVVETDALTIALPNVIIKIRKHINYGWMVENFCDFLNEYFLP